MGHRQLHRILTRRTYIGEHRFNRRSNKGVVKPEDEIVTVTVPSLIDLEVFEAVQNRLKVNNPKVTPPRVVSGPNLLTGICHCGNCGGAMTLRTGKNGRYRYYACSIRARQGETGCKGRAIPMDKLDRIVVSHIEERLLDPERIEDVLASLLDHRQEGVERRSQHIAEFNQRAAEAGTQMLLSDYGRGLGLVLETNQTYIIFYYGLLSLPPPLAISGDDLDEHFQFPVREAIEFVNAYFVARLSALIEQED